MKITNVIKCRTIVVCTNKLEQLLIMLATYIQFITCTLAPAVITMKTKRMEHNTTDIKNQQFFTYLISKTKFTHTAQLKCP